MCAQRKFVQLFSQKVFFGRMTEKYCEGSEQRIAEESAVNLHTKTVKQLAQLPEEFTTAIVTKELGINQNYAYVIIGRWVKDGLVVLKSDSKPKKYQKIETGKTI